MKKPANLIYGVLDAPPPWVTVILGLQHVFVISVGWIFVVVVVTSIGGTPEQATSVIRMSMVASGIATILQARANSVVGSGYLCPFSCGPSYMAASVLAGKSGGMSLVFGMTAVTGVFEALLSRAMPRLRALFPPEVTGLVVSMVGIELVALGCPRVMGFHGPGVPLDGRVVLTALVTIAAMVGPTVWSRGRLRLYPVLLGLGAGYVTAFALGLLTADRIQAAMAVPWLSLPSRADHGWAFSLAFLPAFLIATLSSTLKTVGDLTLCQKINDANWKRTDMRPVAGGILSGSICTIGAGLIGGLGQSTFSSNVGLSIATGATSRRIALPCGIALVLLAFLPRVAAVFSIMPEPVMGAVVVYVAAFMILSGIQVITSRMLDARKIFVVGLSLIFGLSVEMVPQLYDNVPAAIAPFFSSSLSLATVLAVGLNLVFRLGIAKRVRLVLTPGEDHSETIFRFMETHGGAWGAQSDVIHRAMSALNEFAESSAALEITGPITIDVRFDEFSLDVDVQYDGQPMTPATTRPSKAMLVQDDRATAQLAAFLIRQYATGMTCEEIGGRQIVRLHFDH